MPSIHWRDSIGSALITTPALTFANWTPDAEDIGDRATGLGTGTEYLFGFRVDYVVRLEMTHIPPLSLGDLMRLKRHLINGGLITVFTDDAASRIYTCSLKPGSTPSWTLADRTNLDYTLTLELRHVAPVPMIADYSAVLGPTTNLIVNGSGETGTAGEQAPGWTYESGPGGLVPTTAGTFRGARALTVGNFVSGASLNFAGPLDVVAGAHYLLSGWMRADAIAPGQSTGVWLHTWSAAVALAQLAGNGDRWYWADQAGLPSTGVKGVNAATDWTHRWALFRAEQAGAIRAYIVLDAGAGVGAWLSDVRLEPVPAA